MNRDIRIPNTERAHSVGVIGNTKTITQGLQLKNWFMTYNNYEEGDIEIIYSTMKPLCSMFVFQEEQGEEGTRHLQGAFTLVKRMRWSEFKLSNAIHWEKMKDIKASFNYCSKSLTRIGKQYCHNFTPIRELKIVSDENLYPWQKCLKEKIINPCEDDRKIIWVIDSTGNNGKTSFIKHMFKNTDNSVILTSGKHSDIINMVYNFIENNKREPDRILLNIARDCEPVYKTIEDIKDGIIINTKYETGCHLINSPHIVVMANYFPDKSKLSADRWEIYRIINKELITYKYEEIDIDYMGDEINKYLHLSRTQGPSHPLCHSVASADAR